MIVSLIGPSAAGKSSLAARLHAAGAARVVPTVTTRPPRTGEVGQSLDHLFCDEAEFDAMLARGELAATGRLPGLAYRYGLPALDEPGDRPLLVIVRASHVDTLRGLGQPTVVYQIEAAPAVCRQRLAARATGDLEVLTRGRSHAAEIAAGRCVADRSFRNDGELDDLVEAVTSALRHDLKEHLDVLAT